MTRWMIPFLLLATACDSTTEHTVVTPEHTTFTRPSLDTDRAAPLQLGARVKCKDTADPEWCEVPVPDGDSYFVTTAGLAPFPIQGMKRYVVRAAGAPIWARRYPERDKIRTVSAKTELSVDPIPTDARYMRVIEEGVIIGFVRSEWLNDKPTFAGGNPGFIDRTGISVIDGYMPQPIVEDRRDGLEQDSLGRTALRPATRGQGIVTLPVPGNAEYVAVLSDGLIDGYVPSESVSSKPPPAAFGDELLIIAGAKDLAGAQEALEKALEVATGLKPAPGFPKVIESDDIKGLKPGFQIVVLGVCKGTDTLLLDSVLKDYPGSYLRDVVWPEQPLPCPKKDGVGTEAVENASEHGRLIALEVAYGFVAVRALSKEGKVSDRRTVGEEVPGSVGCRATIKTKGDVISINQGCVIPDCTTMASMDVEFEVTLNRRGKIKIKRIGEDYTPGECD